MSVERSTATVSYTCIQYYILYVISAPLKCVHGMRYQRQSMSSDDHQVDDDDSVVVDDYVSGGLGA